MEALRVAEKLQANCPVNLRFMATEALALGDAESLRRRVAATTASPKQQQAPVQVERVQTISQGTLQFLKDNWRIGAASLFALSGWGRPFRNSALLIAMDLLISHQLKNIRAAENRDVRMQSLAQEAFALLKNEWPLVLTFVGCALFQLEGEGNARAGLYLLSAGNFILLSNFIPHALC